MNKYVTFLALLVTGCATHKPDAALTTPKQITAGGKLFTSLFQQHAAEYRALCFQAYNIAKIRLDLALSVSHQKPLAIVTDIDETVLDNSPYAVQRSLLGLDYDPKSWEIWTANASADTLAGAKSFLSYAASKAVNIFYITNRTESEREGTLKNLQRFNFPDAVADHLVLRQTTSSKETRRNDVLKNYEIVLLIGDNLSDFSALYDKRSSEERNQHVSEQSSEFGNKFILLPNPTYGDWETSLYRDITNANPPQKDSLIIRKLKKD